MRFFLCILLLAMYSLCHSQVDHRDLRVENGRFYYKNDTIPYTGKVIGHDVDTRQVVYRAELVDGLAEGLVYLYYENGLYSYSEFKNGIKNGVSKLYHKNGQLLREGVMLDELEEGEWKEYYSPGKISAIIHYKNGLKHGPYQEFDETGQLIKETFYQNDIEVKP